MDSPNRTKPDDLLVYRESFEQGLGLSFQALAKSPLYAGKTLAEAYTQLLPALLTNQYRIVKNQAGEAVAYASWALVSEQVEAKLQAGGALQLSDWQSGKTAVLIDIATKNAKAGELLVNGIKHHLFQDQPLKAIKVVNGKRVIAEVTGAPQNAN